MNLDDKLDFVLYNESVGDDIGVFDVVFEFQNVFSSIKKATANDVITWLDNKLESEENSIEVVDDVFPDEDKWHGDPNFYIEIKVITKDIYIVFNMVTNDIKLFKVVSMEVKNSNNSDSIVDLKSSLYSLYNKFISHFELHDVLNKIEKTINLQI